MAWHLLLVEDEPKIRDMVVAYLKNEGYTISVAANGSEGLELARKLNPDLIILDLMLPVIGGLEVCRQLRQESQVPIIMLTAKAEEVDKLLGLELGADDYITKPFSLRELAARIRVVLRRSGHGVPGTSPLEVISVGDLTLDLNQREVKLGGKQVDLTPTEFSLLHVLMRHPGRAFSRMHLLDAAMGETYAGYERSVDTHISNLRRKIEPDPVNPSYILTVFGVGYKFRSR
ncbi:MAG: response regulator transcription factor [Bacillota bacterium]